MKRSSLALLLGLVFVIALFFGPGCATKEFVKVEMATIDKKVETVQSEIEANQKRLKDHDEKLVSIGSLISQQGSQIKTVDGKITTVDGKIEDVKKMVRGNLVYKATIQNGEAKFAFDSYELATEAKAALDKFVQTLIQMDRGLYLEIQGHTDNTGPDSVNLALGEKRAGAVMAYLYKQYHIPLYRMQIISLGSSMPVADNASREGRGLNRRVEILVYE
jgi:outer membrane protein OmpA-like peptidoglycan-associated protein